MRSRSRRSSASPQRNGRQWRRTRVASRFFFFQAEDGIRDLTVTGVQTCALPISVRDSLAQAREMAAVELNSATDNPLVFVRDAKTGDIISGGNFHGQPLAMAADQRSEERRVGKECRSRWSPYH